MHLRREIVSLSIESVELITSDLLQHSTSSFKDCSMPIGIMGCSRLIVVCVPGCFCCLLGQLKNYFIATGYWTRLLTTRCSIIGLVLDCWIGWYIIESASLYGLYYKISISSNHAMINYFTYSTGKKWRSRRRMLTPSFHFSILKEFFTVIHAKCEELTDRLSDECGDKPFDVCPYISQCSLGIIMGK